MDRRYIDQEPFGRCPECGEKATKAHDIEFGCANGHIWTEFGNHKSNAIDLEAVWFIGATRAELGLFDG